MPLAEHPAAAATTIDDFHKVPRDEIVFISRVCVPEEAGDVTTYTLHKLNGTALECEYTQPRSMRAADVHEPSRLANLKYQFLEQFLIENHVGVTMLGGDEVKNPSMRRATIVHPNVDFYQAESSDAEGVRFYGLVLRVKGDYVKVSAVENGDFDAFYDELAAANLTPRKSPVTFNDERWARRLVGGGVRNMASEGFASSAILRAKTKAAAILQESNNIVTAEIVHSPGIRRNALDTLLQRRLDVLYRQLRASA